MIIAAAVTTDNDSHKYLAQYLVFFKCFTNINAIHSQKAYKVRVIMSILQMRKVKYTVVENVSL